MADSPAKSTYKKKRKLNDLGDKSKALKRHSVDVPERRMEVDARKASNVASPPWSNLQLILSLQNNEIQLHKKVELALDYVNSREKGVSEREEDIQTVNVSRLLVFLNDWVQPVLLSDGKKVRGESVLTEGYLDYRCWLIFKFCLEESLRLRILLNLSGDLLKSFRLIARNALSLLTDTSSSSKELAFTGDGFKLYSLVLDCASLVFLSHGGVANEKLDSWFETVSEVLELVRLIFRKKLDSSNAGIFALRFSCLLLEPFAKFLKVHPARKEKYKVFVDKLVEPLLHLLGILRLHADARTGSLLTVVQEVLLQGLFHSVHIDGYLGLHSLEKYSPSNDGNVNYIKTSTESYHRHFFNKLESVVASKKSELSGLGELFHLLVDKVRKQRKLSLAEKTEGSKHLSHIEPSKDSYESSNLTADRRKSLWNFFVWIMEHLLREMEVGPPLMDAYFTLKSINSLLAYLLDEKLYIKTEDFSEGACLSFLKRVCNTVSSFSTHLCSLYVHDTVGESQEIIISLGREVLVAIQYFFDIEYEILGNELSSLWLMVLSYFALGHSLRDVPNHCLLATQARGFGCYLIKLYSELRQVEKIILALFEAVRCITIIHEDKDCRKNSFGGFINKSLSEAYAKSVQMLLCEHEFKLAISESIKSLPEMQVSECIEKLRDDLAKSIEWMQSYCSVTDGIKCPESNTKEHSMLFQTVEMELFGGGLSELYALIIDSLTVTAGNSGSVGKYVKKLIAVLCPFMSILAGQPHGINEFLVYVTGESSNKEHSGNKSVPISFGASTHWIFVFFFRLYISCRSLYRQTITFMPPDKLREKPANMLDCFATYTGNDLIKRTEWIKEEYFSLAVQPSASLLAVINSVSEICMCGSTTGNWPLIYVFHVMVLQRLVDLNKQITSLKYILQRNSRIKAESLDDASHLSALNEEAEGLAEFITSHLSLLGSGKISVCSNDDETGSLASYESHGWDFGVASLNEDSGPIAIWWILCQNVDVWSPHASKKKLKKFLSLVLCTSLLFISRGCRKGKSCKTDEAGFLNKINVHQISSDLLASSIFYEQPFVHKHLASAFCCLLKKSVLPVFSDLSFENLDLKTSPDWEDILGKNDSLPKVVSRNQPVIYDMQLEGKAVSSLHVKFLADIPVESAGLKFIACQSLLSLLSWIPKGCMTSKSLSVYVTCLLNLERYVIKSLLERRDALFLNYQYQLLRFLVSCRRVLKVIIKGFCENRIFQSSIIPVLSEDLFAVVWLFKSVNLVIGLQDVLSQYQADQVRARMCSLMDHTSQLFLILNKHYFNCAFERCASDGPDSRLFSLENSIGWKLAESLKEQTEGVLIHLKKVLGTEKEGVLVNMVNIESVPSILSCLSGFMWGLVSALDNIQAIDNDKIEIFSLLFKQDSKLKLCIDDFAEFICFVSNMLFAEDGRWENGSFDAHYDSCGLPSSEKLQSEVPSVASVLSKPDTYQCTLSNNCLLRSLLKGDNPQAATIIRQLLIASSALLRLNLKTNCTPAVSSLVPIYIDICQVLLVKLADLSEVPKLSSFLWLDGVLSYLQELWCHFPSNIDSESSRNVYTSLIEMQLNALGTCISLQRKEATVASYVAQSRSKILSSEEESDSHLSLFLDEFKARLRMSLDALLRRSSDFHRQSAVHVIMRALVGLKHGCAEIYNLSTGSRHGGKVSPCVAAGIDCLDLLVEHVSGGRKLDVSESIQSVISALFNIVIHLQSPLVYYSVTSCTVPKGPDPGAVILMSVEVLTRISGKHALFRMNQCHVALSLRMPAVIFQDFCQIRETETFNPVDNQDSDIVVDKQFLVALFGACCRLLSTTLRHHKSESEQSIALLQESVRVLLHCLETLDSDLTSRKPYFQMGVQEGVKFACSLRRIYEELRQQKEDFGKHCFKFLSDYILVYSRIGPLKTGIRREVDEALKPGVYALVDCCSADDLQHLHSVYGEGPCRNTLASLRQDYKLNFQYEGKV